MPRTPSSLDASTSALQRGRPRVQPYTVEEVAELLAVEPAQIERALLPQFRKDFFPHAFESAEGWKIPPRDLRILLGPKLPKPYWVSEFAELIGFSVPYVNELIRGGIIKTRQILGSARVPETEFWNLPTWRPEGLKKRPRTTSDGQMCGRCKGTGISSLKMHQGLGAQCQHCDGTGQRNVSAAAPPPPSFFSEEVPGP